MSSSEADKSSKEDKEANDAKTPTSQEQAPASGAVPADWTGFQAYSPIPPPGFLASSPQATPYMWGVQPFIPPYGAPPHSYVAMYPHGGLYPTMAPGTYPFSPFSMPPHNGVAEGSGISPSVEVDGKSSEGKGKLPIKRSKGSLGSLNMITGKKNVSGNEAGTAANGAHSKSDESASEGSDANSQHESQVKSSDSAGTEEPSQNGAASQNGGSSGPHDAMAQTLPIVPVPAVGAVSGIPGPPTNLNIGIDYWATATSPTIPAMQGKVPAAPVTGLLGPGTRDGIQSQIWLQDERELKRQRRKQSNRESARRSRLRKQAECDELAQRAEALKEENMSLRAEITRLKSEYEQLLAQNASLKERLGGHEGIQEEEDGQ